MLETESTEIAVIDTSVLSALTRAEIDQQITTAKAYPRSITKFMQEANELVTMNEEIAEECFYTLPARRSDNPGEKSKPIMGPSARLAEILMSCWGNNRNGARVVAIEGEHIVSQGVFHDLERNAHTTFEVRRRIVKRDGTRYGADMIAVTGNAACSIALRNAVCKGIPKAFWIGIYNNALKAAKGDVKTVSDRRKLMMEHLVSNGVSEQQVFQTLGIGGIDDMGLDELFTLKGILNAIKEGDTTYQQAFSDQEQTGQSAETEKLNATLKTGKASATKADPVKPTTPADFDITQPGKPEPQFTVVDVKAKITKINELIKKAKRPADWVKVSDLLDETVDMASGIDDLPEETVLEMDALTDQVSRHMAE